MVQPFERVAIFWVNYRFERNSSEWDADLTSDDYSIMFELVNLFYSKWPRPSLQLFLQEGLKKSNGLSHLIDTGSTFWTLETLWSPVKLTDEWLGLSEPTSCIRMSIGSYPITSFMEFWLLRHENCSVYVGIITYTYTCQVQ